MIKAAIVIFWFLYLISLTVDTNSLFFTIVEYSAIFALVVHLFEYLFFYKRIAQNTKFLTGFLMTMIFGYAYIMGLRK